MAFYAVKHQRHDLLGHFLRNGRSPDIIDGPGLPLLAFAFLNDYGPEMREMIHLLLQFSATASIIP